VWRTESPKDLTLILQDEPVSLEEGCWKRRGFSYTLFGNYNLPVATLTPDLQLYPGFQSGPSLSDFSESKASCGIHLGGVRDPRSFTASSCN